MTGGKHHAQPYRHRRQPSLRETTRRVLHYFAMEWHSSSVLTRDLLEFLDALIIRGTDIRDSVLIRSLLFILALVALFRSAFTWHRLALRGFDSFLGSIQDLFELGHMFLNLGLQLRFTIRGRLRQLGLQRTNLRLLGGLRVFISSSDEFHPTGGARQHHPVSPFACRPV